MAWEKLVKEYLVYKYDNVIYHAHLPNKMIPDFMTSDKKIILDAKRNDFLEIDKCIKKYGPYCEKLVFICMEKKRKNWKNDFKKNKNIYFWYPENILCWIPNDQHEAFLKKLKEIESIWVTAKKNESQTTLQATIKHLEKEKKSITQLNISKKLGISKESIRKDIALKQEIENYKKETEFKKTLELEKKVKDTILYLNENNKRISFQNIARELIRKNSKIGSDKENTIDKQLLWRKTKILSTNKKTKKLIINEIREKDQKMKKEILEAIDDLKTQKEKVTIFDIRKYTHFSKNYLYSSEIKQLIENKIKKFDITYKTVNEHFRCKISMQEVETIITELKAKKKNLSKREIQRQLHCDHKAIKNNQEINNFIENEIKVHEQKKRQLIIEAIENIKDKHNNLSIQAVILKTGLSKKFIRKKENKILIENEIAEIDKSKKQKVIETVLNIKKQRKKVTKKLIQEQTGVSRKYLEKQEIEVLIKNMLK